MSDQEANSRTVNINSQFTTQNSKQILVTGAAGFIDLHLCKRLLECGGQVIGIDNLNNYYDVTNTLD